MSLSSLSHKQVLHSAFVLLILYLGESVSAAAGDGGFETALEGVPQVKTAVTCTEDLETA